MVRVLVVCLAAPALACSARSVFDDGAGEAYTEDGSSASEAGESAPETELACDPPGSSWTEAVALENDEGDAYGPRLAVGADGAVTAVWEQVYRWAFDDKVRMSRHRYGNWESATWVQPEHEDLWGTEGPRVAADGHGGADVVWQQADDLGEASIWEARVDAAGFAVGHVQPLDEPNAFPRLAMNGDGDAVLAWNQVGRMSARYRQRADSAWSDEVVLQEGGHSGVRLDAVIDPAGSATVVWYQTSSGDPDRMFAARYDSAAAQWGAPVLLSGGAGSTARPRAAADTAGNVTVTWAEFDGAGHAVLAARFDAALRAWETGTRLDRSDGDAHDPDVAVASDGTTIVAWDERGRIAVAVRDSDSGWDAPLVVDTRDETIGVEGPSVGIDDRGCATLVWSESPHADWDVAAVRVDVRGKEPGHRVVLDAGAPWAYGATAVVHGGGMVTAAWVNDASGAGDVVAARFE